VVKNIRRRLQDGRGIVLSVDQASEDNRQMAQTVFFDTNHSLRVASA
jgi:hypothetical protein